MSFYAIDLSLCEDHSSAFQPRFTRLCVCSLCSYYNCFCYSRNKYYYSSDASNCLLGPSGVARCTIEPRSDGTHLVNYAPTEVGEFSVTVRWNGREIQGQVLTVSSNFVCVPTSLYFANTFVAASSSL